MILFLWVMMVISYGSAILIFLVSLSGSLSTAGFIMVPLWAILGTLSGSAAALLTRLHKN